LPAPRPKSPIAGVTNPTMINGIANDRKFPNRELNVTNMRESQSGKNCPKTIPKTMAITTLSSSDTFGIFIFLKYFVANRSDKYTHQWTYQIEETVR